MFDKIKLKINVFRSMLRFKRRFKSYGKDVVICSPCMLTNPKCIEIGDRVYIREYARMEAVFEGTGSAKPVLKIGNGTKIEQFFHVGACEYVEIGENVLIAGRVYISDHNHTFSDIEKPIWAQGIEPGGRVVIEKNAWLGEGCVILAGTTIGRNSIVGANAVVTKSIPPFSIAAGVPAKVIKTYNPATREWVKCTG